MPNAQVLPEIRQSRKSALAPIFSHMDERGIKYVWLARRLNISKERLTQYKNGANEMPATLLTLACEALGFPEKSLKIPPANRKRTRKFHHLRTQIKTA